MIWKYQSADSAAFPSGDSNLDEAQTNKLSNEIKKLGLSLLGDET